MNFALKNAFLKMELISKH